MTAAGSPSAAGAALDQVVIATVGAIAFTGALLALGIGHRAGRVPLLGKAADAAGRLVGLPGWAALPAALVTVSLITALFGMLWDISLHIDEGRDAGPLANPAHYFILVGLYGVFAGGFLAMVLPRRRPSASAIRITSNWYAPLGGILIAACGAFSLTGFPLDDIWHRLFGQDVTLWGPTHLMLIGGAAMTTLGLAVLLVEGVRASEARGHPDGRLLKALGIATAGAFLLGLSTFQGEFDFGVPQFRFVFHPMLIMFAAGAALVAARIWVGPGAAIGAAVFFLAMRGVIALVVGPVLGEATPHFPLYAAEAALIELLALGVDSRRNPVGFGLRSGVLIGTLGLAAEWWWSHLTSPLPWPGELLPEAALLGFAMALAGSLIGAWVGARLASDAVPRRPSLRIAAVAGAVAIAGMVGYALDKPAREGVTASMALEDVRGGPGRSVDATVTVDPPDAASDAEWLTVTAWQGGGLVVDSLESAGGDTYRTTEPVPVHDEWKSLLRLHVDNSLMAVPIYLPEDPAIPAEGVAATPRFTREFVADHEILQREQKDAASGLTTIAYVLVLAIALGFIVLIVWGLHRLAVVSPGDAGPVGRDRSPRGAPAERTAAGVSAGLTSARGRIAD